MVAAEVPAEANVAAYGSWAAVELDQTERERRHRLAYAAACDNPQRWLEELYSALALDIRE